MLLEEGLELYREGQIKESVRQFNEGINLCAYMKKEGIAGHADNLEKLLMEKASVQLNSVSKVLPFSHCVLSLYLQLPSLIV